MGKSSIIIDSVRNSQLLESHNRRVGLELTKQSHQYLRTYSIQIKAFPVKLSLSNGCRETKKAKAEWTKNLKTVVQLAITLRASRSVAQPTIRSRVGTEAKACSQAAVIILLWIGLMGRAQPRAWTTSRRSVQGCVLATTILSWCQWTTRRRCCCHFHKGVSPRPRTRSYRLRAPMLVVTSSTIRARWPHNLST